MQQPVSLRRALTLGFGTALALGALPSVVHAAAGKEPSQVGTANFDRVQERLVIPVQGGAPKIVVRRLAPRQYVADLAGSVLIGGEAQGQRLRSPALAGWSLDEEPATKTVRLRMTLTTDVHPRVRFDRRTGGYVVSFATPAPTAAAPAKPKPRVKTAIAPKAPAPHRSTTAIAVTRTAAPTPPLSRQDLAQRLAQRRLPAVTAAAPALKPPAPRAAVAPKPVAAKPAIVARKPVVVAQKPVAVAPRPVVVVAKPVVAPKPSAHRTFLAHAPAPARLGVPAWDAARGLLVVPVEGEIKARDLDVYRLSKRWSYLDIPHARPTFTGVWYQERADKVFQRWVMAKRPGRDTTRLSFALGAPAAIDVELAGKELLIAIRPETPMLGAAPKPAAVAAKPAAVAAKPAAVAAKPATVAAQPEPVVAKPEPAAPAAKPLPSTPVVKPRVLAEAPVKPAAPRLAVQPAAKPAPLALVRRNPVPAGAIETRLRRPFYDAERFGLVIPYEGRTPLFRWKQKGEGAVALELKGDVVSAAHLQPETRRHAALGAWTFERRGAAGTLALDMTFARPSELVVAADPDRKQLLLIPQPRLHGERAAGSARPKASLASVAMDRDGTNLFIPFNGEVPRYTIEQVNASFAYINFERAALKETGVQFYAPDYHPTVNYWMVTQPEGTTTVRLAVALARPGATAVYQDPSQGRLVVVVGDDAPVVQATGPRTPQLPAPWPGAVAPGRPLGEPVSLKEAS